MSELFHSSTWINGIRPVLPPAATKSWMHECCFFYIYIKHRSDKGDVDADSCGLISLNLQMSLSSKRSFQATMWHRTCFHQGAFHGSFEELLQERLMEMETYER